MRINFKFFTTILILCLALLVPCSVSADEVNNEVEEIVNEGQEVLSDFDDELEPEETNEEKTNEEETNEEENLNEIVNSDDNDSESEQQGSDSKRSGNAVVPEEHKVSVITKKVDEDGNPLSGAVLQILDSNGNIMDEWTTNGQDHETMLSEGTYTLHEKSAPEGYEVAADKTFTVKVELNDMDAGVDFSETPCSHYGGTPLYYVESEGQKEEVYCINQDWETPDDNSKYDGAVLSETDIRNFTTQTIKIDAYGNKASVDISDQSLSSVELYNKILDIIYHRQKASSIFTDLTEAEIRYVTESALKNYTNAGLTRVQGVRKQSDIPEGATEWAYYNGYYWYLYTHYRSFIYNPNAPLGQDIFKTVVGGGDAFGTLARHWSSGHNAKNSAAVRAKIARYYELYLYLISDSDHHPSDMHLYIFFTKNKALDVSADNFDDGAYQNLLGIRWFNPYDDSHKVNLVLVDKKIPEKKEKKEKKKYNYSNPYTGDNVMSYFIALPLSFFSAFGGTVYLRTRRKED